jgi:hypothetical protein
MSTEQDRDTSRTAVKTYVPAYQKERWRDHAEELGMSQSEFVRTMVQAGRASFEIPENGSGETAADDASDAAESTLERRVVDVLAGESPLTWEELVEALTGGIEDRLEDALDGLQADDRVRYSGRRGGYTLVEGDDGD